MTTAKDERNDGGAAFPTTRSEVGGDQTGLTMRDYFAAAALTGIIAKADLPLKDGYPEAMAVDAYWLADAMLNHRGK